MFSRGANTFGQLGLGHTTNVYNAIDLTSLFPTKVVNIQSKRNGSLVFTEDGKIYVFGRNLQGDLCTGNTNDALQPIDISSLFYGKTVIAIAAQQTSVV